MTTPIRLIFDTNAIVSALLLKQSISRKAFDKGRSTGVFLLSLATLEELNEVLRRDKFNKYVTEQERLKFLSTLVRESELVEIHEFVQICRDPKDDKFLDLAINGTATCIISGDKDLLTLHPFRGVPILTPKQFLNR